MGQVRWISSRVEYECIPDFVSPAECRDLIDGIQASRNARNSHSGGVIHPLLVAIDARLCARLGFEPSAGGALHSRYLEAHEPPLPGDASTKLSAYITLNDVEAGGEFRLGSSTCRVPARRGSLLIARPLQDHWDPRFALCDLPVRKGFKAMLVRHFAEDSDTPELDTPPLALHHTRIAQPLFARLRAFHDEHAARAIEEHVPGFIESASSVASRLAGLPPDLQHEVHSALQPMVEAWAGRPVAPTFVYGVRRYLRGASLRMHRDRNRTHVYGASLNIDQKLDSPWPLVIEDTLGRRHDVVLRPGEMVLYESRRLLHGRPQPLRGDFYAGVFAHFRPASLVPSSFESSGITGCFPCARSH